MRRKLFTPLEARRGLALLRAIVEPTPTGDLGLHKEALEIGMTVGHPTYDTLYIAFARAVGAERVVAADAPFVKAMRTHPDPAVAGMMVSLAAWDGGHGG